MLLSQSNRLDIGAELGVLTLRDVKPVINETRAIPVKNCDAAGMFVMNMKAWKDSQFVHKNYQRVRIGDLERELGAIAAGRSQKREIEWQMRQKAWRRE